MRKKVFCYALLLLFFIPSKSRAQVDTDQWGSWLMYFYDATFAEGPWGVQGDIQYRSWDVIGDLEQLLLRSGLTYAPQGANIKMTLGYAYISSGEFGDGDATSAESRIYQEALIPFKVGNRFYFNNRFRYEQRFVDGQDFRTRYRYNLFLNIPLNNTEIVHKTIYLALYNEIFLNGQRSIGEDRTVEIFDRNRFYAALGYKFLPNVKGQLGVMLQETDAYGGKPQLQLSIHHSIR